MAQINLLKHSSGPDQTFSGVWPILAKLLMVAMVAAVAWYGYIYYQIGQQEKQTASIREEVASEKKDPALEKQRQELAMRQAQLGEFSTLLQTHPYWSSLLPVLASSTLQVVSYDSLKALNDGTVVLTATAPDHASLDKFLQVFNDPDVNKNFKDVRINGISREQEGDTVRIKFEIRMKYNPQLLMYKK